MESVTDVELAKWPQLFVMLMRLDIASEAEMDPADWSAVGSPVGRSPPILGSMRDIRSVLFNPRKDVGCSTDAEFRVAYSLKLEFHKKNLEI